MGGGGGGANAAGKSEIGEKKSLHISDEHPVLIVKVVVGVLGKNRKCRQDAGKEKNPEGNVCTGRSR